MAWRSLRSRWFVALSSVIAVALGAALATAALILAQSADATTPAGASTPWTLRDVDLVVRMPDTVPAAGGADAVRLTERRRLTAAQLATVRATPGVTSVTAETPSPAYVVAGGRTIGDAVRRSWAHPWSTALAEPVTLTAGAAPRSGEVVLDVDTAVRAGVGVGDQVDVTTVQGTSAYRLAGIGYWPGAGREHAVFVTDEHAAELGGGPLLALVRVTGDRAAVAGAVRAALPGVKVTADRAQALILDRRQAELSGGSSSFVTVMAAGALGIAGFVIAGTLSVAVAQRRREFAVLRAAGATPGRIRRLVVGEAAFTGLLGGVLGGVAGIGVAAVAIVFFTAQGMLASSVRLVLGGTPFVVGVGAAVLTAVLAGSLPAWRASRIAPAEALRVVDVQPPARGRVRAVAGFLMLAAAAGLVAAGGYVARTGGPIGLQVAGVLFLSSAPFGVLAAVLLGRVLLAGLLAALRRPLQRSFGGFLAIRQIRSDLDRAVGVTTPVLVMVSFACLLIFQEQGTSQGRAHGYDQQLRADLVVRGAEHLGVSPAVAGRVAGVDGVAAASGMINTRIVVPADGPSTGFLEAVAVDPATVPALWRLPVAAGAWSAFDEAAIAVDAATAAAQGWHAGAPASFLLPDGTPARATVAVIVESVPATFTVLVPRSMILGHVLEPYDAGVLVALQPGADASTVAARIDALRVVDPNVRALSRGEFRAFVGEQSSGDTWIIHLFVVLIGGYAGISAVNVLIGAATARRGQFASLRLAGASTAHVVRAVVGETAILVLAGVLAGTVVAAVPLAGYGYVFTGGLWLPFAAGPYALICAAALSVGAIGSLVSIRLVRRARLVDAAGVG